MSVSNFQQNFSNKLLDKLETEMRKSVEKQSGQLLILPGPDQLKKAVLDTFNNSIVISDYHYAKAVEKGRKQALKLHNLFKVKSRDRYLAVISKLPDLGLPSSFVMGDNMFVVTSFNYSINSVKLHMLNYFKSKKLLTDTQKTELSKNIHKGHGVRGSAVSQVEIANAVSSIPMEYKDSLSSAFSAWSKKASIPKDIRVEINKLFVNHTQIIDRQGNLRDDYVSNVVFQVGSENIGKDATFEKSVKKAFRAFASEYSGNLINEKGSSSLKQKVTAHILMNLGKSKKVRVISKDKNVKAKTTHKTNTKGKSKKVGKSKVSPGGAIKKTRVNKSVSSMPLQLIVALNKQLPQVIAKNMDSPALEFQTGRFASGVKVTDIVKTPKGFPSIGYTYDKFPYQTFEPGFAQGSVERDPRKLIDRSIREIAAQYAIGRFYTRRV